MFRHLIVLGFVLMAGVAEAQPSSVCGDGVKDPGEQCDDGNLDPSDCCDSNCQNNNQGICSDGDACTTDSCQSGSCVGTPVVCSALDSCHDVGTCDSGTGLCSNPEKNNGSPCDDGDACTQNDECRSGTCTGTNLIVCTALDQCHEVGVCNLATGTCTNPIKQNGSSCNDGNDCTQSDTCQSGSCEGSDEVVCTALDTCHNPGVCNPANGECSNPVKSDGSPCDDQEDCTPTDECLDGICIAGGSRCGDGVPDADCGEECDDGNHLNGDCCNSSCFFEPINNPCNDQNTCSPVDTCNGAGLCFGSGSQCGNGATEKNCGEGCDDAGHRNGDGCNSNCQLEFCGDGSVNNFGKETCEDGNTVDDDGCDSNCTITACGNGVVTSGEECDDGPDNDDVTSDACRLNCTLPFCGDDITDVLHGEECDDGDTLGGDGCDQFCLNETDPTGGLGGDDDDGDQEIHPSPITGGCHLIHF